MGGTVPPAGERAREPLELERDKEKATLERSLVEAKLSRGALSLIPLR
jgi:hypothetical protein